MDQKISQLTNLPVADQADLYAIVDTSAGETKNINQEQVEDTIANSDNFVDELIANNNFTTELAQNSNFVSELTENTDFQNSVKNFITVVGGSGAGGTKLFVDTTETTVGSSASGNLYSKNIPAGTLGINNAIKFKLLFKDLLTGSGSSDMQISLQYGGSTFATIDLQASTIASPDTGYIEGWIIANNATNQQKGYLQIVHGGDPANFAQVGNVIYFSGSEDSTIDANLIVSVVNSVNMSITAESIVGESINGIGFSQPMSFTLPGTNSSTNSLNSYYSDREAFVYFDGIGFTLSVNALPNNFTRDLSIDWGSMVAGGITSAAIFGNAMYVLLRDSSDNHRLYKYDLTNSATPGVLCTFSGASLGSQSGVTMSSDGSSLYFSYQGGNSASDNIISKYSISGSTITFVSNTTMVSATGFFTTTFLVSRIGHYFGTTTFDGVIKEYDSSGTLVLTTATRAFPGNESANISNCFYGCVNATIFTYCKIYLSI